MLLIATEQHVTSSKIISISKEKNQCPISEINQQIAENIEETELIE